LNELPLLAQQLVTRLKRVDDDYKIVKLFVKIKFSDFTVTTIERSAGSVSPSELQELCKEAHARKGIAVRLLGVGVSFIDLREDKAFYQLDLFK
jgi:DNA polymerase IV